MTPATRIPSPVRVRHALDMLRELGSPVPSGSAILDLGCGTGQTVAAFREAGYQAFGCDMAFPAASADPLKALLAEGIVRRIAADPYRLPFAEEAFDVVLSEQVLEHVTDYPAALAEIRRVLKPGAVSLHVFPSRYKLIEPHVYVPLASMVRSLGWLRFWAALGIRNEFQKSLSASKTAAHNRAYLTRQTNYLPPGRIAAAVGRCFDRYVFAERIYLKTSRFRKRRKLLYLLACACPPVARLYGMFHTRVLVFWKAR
jgi:SAM-dependent methyltransferase